MNEITHVNVDRLFGCNQFAGDFVATGRAQVNIIDSKLTKLGVHLAIASPAEFNQHKLHH